MATARKTRPVRKTVAPKSRGRKTTAAPRRRPAAKAKGTVVVVNMIPKSLSGEKEQENAKDTEKKQKEGSPYPYLNVSMQHADGKEECKGQIFLVLSFHPNALWNLKDFLKKAKVNWTKQGFNYSDLVGKTLRVTTGIEPSQRDPEVIVTVVKPPYHVG